MKLHTTGKTRGGGLIHNILSRLLERLLFLYVLCISASESFVSFNRLIFSK